MTIITTGGIRQLDVLTISKEPISSINLMERASKRWLEHARPFISQFTSFLIVAGKGNNGGDGLAIARLLAEEGYEVRVAHCYFGGSLSADCQTNTFRFKSLGQGHYQEILREDDIADIPWQKSECIIDALFGIGLNSALRSPYKRVVDALNESNRKVISVDCPSGLLCDAGPDGSHSIVEADYTLTFQFPKLSFLFPESASYLGTWKAINIGLLSHLIDDDWLQAYYVDEMLVKSILQKRTTFSHKGSFGHAHVVGGTKGMMGAAILASKACLKIGTGLVTCHLHESGHQALLSASPEIMTANEEVNFQNSGKKIDALAIGPGLGQTSDSLNRLRNVLSAYKGRLVMDADALNLLAENESLWDDVPKNTILTPHPKELERLIGKTSTSFEQLAKTQELADERQVFILIKRAYTVTVSPNSKPHFNSTGNPGMATAGSGDVLTGIIAGLLSQGYTSKHACVLGVYLHGLAGDIAAEQEGEAGLTAQSLIDFLGKAQAKISA